MKRYNYSTPDHGGIIEILIKLTFNIEIVYIVCLSISIGAAKSIDTYLRLKIRVVWVEF